MTDRQTGGVGVNVDLAVNPNRQLGAIGVNVDYVPGAGGATYPITASATQAQAVSLIVCVPRRYSDLETRTYAQLETMTYAQLEVICLTAGATYPITRSLTQPQSVALQLRRSLVRTVSATQAQLVALSRAYVYIRSITQAQAVARLMVSGHQRIVSVTQSQAVALRRTIGLLGSLTAQTGVSLLSNLARAVPASQPQSPRLVQQIRLTRSVTQAQTVSRQGISVKTVAIATIQTRSLALGRVISLVRTIAQPQQALLARAQSVLRAVSVAPVLDRVQQVSLTRAVAQGSAVSLSTRNVTRFYQVLVTTSVHPVVSLSQAAGAGKPARGFVVIARQADFVVAQCRVDAFTVARRGVTFTVEER